MDLRDKNAGHAPKRKERTCIGFLQDPVPEHGYRALLRHFGLEREDVSLTSVVKGNPSPAILARVRRIKENLYDLPRLEMKNQRLGCSKDEVADYFEAA